MSALTHSSPRLLSIITALLTSIPALTAAQTVSFADLSKYVKVGQVVALTDADGRRAEGKVAEIGATSVALRIDGATLTFPEAAVRRVVVKDSLLNGTLIGFAAGAVPGAMLGALFRQYCENEATSCDAMPVVAGALYGAIGAGAGAGIDALIRRSLDVAPPGRVRMTLSPSIAPGRQGLQVSVRF